MASPLSQKTLDKVALYATKHFSPKIMGFSCDMRLRILIAEQLFQAYASGKVPMTRMPIKVVPAIAERTYRMILEHAATDPDMEELRQGCGIVEGLKRSYGEMTNDIKVYELLRSQWGVDTSHHDKAVYKETAYALIEMGQEQGNERAMKSGADMIANVNNNFQEKTEDFARTADTEIDFISDARLVRADADNISRQGIEEAKKKWGAFIPKQGGIDALLAAHEAEYEEVPSEDGISLDDDHPYDRDLDFFEATDPLKNNHQ